MDSNITIRIDNATKQLAMKNAKELGMDLSQVVRMLIKQLAVKPELPQGLLQPNEETLQAIYEMENSINVTRYTSVNELAKDLGL